MRNMFRRMQSTAQAGFTILEVLMASVVFSIALVALSSISFTVIGGNKHSGNFVKASAVAQEQIETIRASVLPLLKTELGGFNLGADMVLGTADDVIPVQLANGITANDALTSPSAMFANPDYTQNGSATPLVLSTTPQAAWVVRDNIPVAGMKTVSVVVGWLEGTAQNYVVVSTAIQGQ
ncbi:MAG: prepilin-type N-terminal cleavage/methylation domain-containing protein [Nitrospinae bacterium]|nr:prepilin-type N-terminal cleavage/methylation domain-containing protein [Nitrospinota bacterium]